MVSYRHLKTYIPHPHIGGWAVFFVAALFYTYEFIQRLSPTAMIPELIADLHISAASMGQLSAFYYYAYASFQIPAGILTDRGNIRHILGCSALLVAIGSLLQGSATHIFVIYAARALIGVGSAFAFVSCLKLSASWFEAKHLPLLVGLINLCGVFGAILSGAPLTWLIKTIGWRPTLLWGGFIGLLIAGAIFKAVRRGPLQQAQEKAPQQTSEGLFMIILSKQSWLAACYAALLVAPLAAFSELWSIPFLMKAYQLPAALATFANSLVFFGIAVGGPVIGWLATTRRFAMPKLMRLCATGTLLCFISVLIFTQMPQWLLFALLIGYGALTSHMLLCFSFATLQHPSWANGLAIGFTNTIVMLGGSLLQPLIGSLLDYRLLHVAQGRIEFLSTLDYQIVLGVLPLFLLAALAIIRFIEIPDSLKKI